jgi:hypothetical protein
MSVPGRANSRSQRGSDAGLGMRTAQRTLPGSSNNVTRPLPVMEKLALRFRNQTVPKSRRRQQHGGGLGGEDVLHLGDTIRQDEFLVSEPVGIGIEALALQRLEVIAPGLRIGRPAGSADPVAARARQVIARLLDEHQSWRGWSGASRWSSRCRKTRPGRRNEVSIQLSGTAAPADEGV